MEGRPHVLSTSVSASPDANRFHFCHGCCTIPATFVSVLCILCFAPFLGNWRKTV